MSGGPPVAELTARRASDFVGLWNINDGEAAWLQCERVLDPEFQYRDPLQAVHRRDEMPAALKAFHIHFPEHRVVCVTAIEVHHDVFRYGWRVEDRQRNIVLHGQNVGQASSTGLKHVWGFFGSLKNPDVVIKAESRRNPAGW